MSMEDVKMFPEMFQQENVRNRYSVSIVAMQNLYYYLQTFAYGLMRLWELSFVLLVKLF